jgi:hypothetical protein
VDSTFDLLHIKKYIQGIKIEDGMSIIIHSNSINDGVYIIARSQLVRLTPLIGGETYHVCHGLYRNTDFTVPKPDAYGKRFLKRRCDALNKELENFLIIDEDDDGSVFNVTSTALYHIITIINTSKHDIDVVVHENIIVISSKTTQRYVVCPQKVVLV